MERQRALLLPRIGTVFEHADALRTKRVELQQIKDAIRAQSQSPEAIAAREAATQRLMETGRKPTWSLDWNPTQYMLDEAGINTVEEYRHAIHEMEASRARTYAEEHPATIEATAARDAAALARRGTSPSTHQPQTPSQSPAARRHDVSAQRTATTQREETQR